MGEVLVKEAWRAGGTRSDWAAKTLGPALVHFGQRALGLKCGGEGMATARWLQEYKTAAPNAYRVTYKTSLHGGVGGPGTRAGPTR